ncbi:hypothetical protein [Methylocystis sp. S23]
MSTWFTDQRQDFIRATLVAFGQIRRADIAERFKVTIQIASKDISDFMAAHPDAIIYDGRAKTYVLDKEALTALEAQEDGRRG